MKGHVFKIFLTNQSFKSKTFNYLKNTQKNEKGW